MPTFSKLALLVLGKPLYPAMTLFGLLVALVVAHAHTPLVGYYKWFLASGLEIAKYRGYGQSTCCLYGTCTHTHTTHVPQHSPGTHSH